MSRHKVTPYRLQFKAMNEYTKYLKNQLEDYSRLTILSAEEQKQITFEGVVAFIIKKINSNKYKGSKYPTAIAEKVKTIVTEAVARSKPIHFSVPFGGFKKWQYETYPSIDWAEIFNIIQLRNFAIEIAKGYEPGVIIQYVSDEVFVSRMNNMPQEDLDKYNNLFNLAIAYVQQFTPSNVMLRYTKIRDEISQKEVLLRFEKGISELRAKWDELPLEDREKRIEKTKRNLKIDESKFTKEELQEKYLDSTLVHDAFIFTDWEQGVPWAFRSDMIPVGFRYTGTWGINLMSSPTSSVQFWVGFGVLEQRGDNYLQRILTYNQFKDVEKSIKYEKCEALPSIFGLEKIPVLVS